MQPFDLPRGTIRASIVALLTLGAIVLGIWGQDGAFTAFVALDGVAVRDYFAHREAEDRRSGPVVPPSVSNDDVE